MTLACPTCHHDLTEEVESTLDSGLCPMCQERVPVETLHALQSLPRIQSASPNNPVPGAPPASEPFRTSHAFREAPVQGITPAPEVAPVPRGAHASGGAADPGGVPVSGGAAASGGAPHSDHPAHTPPPGSPAHAAGASPAREPVPGSLLAGCRIERLLGRGGMGAVYLAHHLALDLDVAVKILPPAPAVDEAQATERFIREARAVARLNHPHMIRVLHAGCEDGCHFIVMEHVDGGSLEQRLRHGARLPLPEALRIFRETAEGLACAHDHGIVHRDIKPDNILLTREGTVKVADFGLAKRVGQDSALTCAGSGMGTPNYIAPEQASDAVGVDPRADLYSLACTVYRMLTGHVPYEGRTPYETVSMHLHAPVPNPAGLCPDIPPPLSALLMRLMAKAPADRLPDAHAVLAAIRDLRGGCARDPASTPGAVLDAPTIPETPSAAHATGEAGVVPVAPPTPEPRCTAGSGDAPESLGAAGCAPSARGRVPRMVWVAGGVVLAGGIAAAVFAPSLFAPVGSSDSHSQNGQKSTHDADKLPKGVVLAHITDFPSGSERPMEGTTLRPQIPEEWEAVPAPSWELAQIQDLPGGLLTDGGIVVHDRGVAAPSHMPPRRGGSRMPVRSEGFHAKEFRFEQERIDLPDVVETAETPEAPGAPIPEPDVDPRREAAQAALESFLEREGASRMPGAQSQDAQGADPYRPPALLELYRRAQGAQRAENWGKARRLYEEALAGHPGFLDLHLAHVVVLEKELGFQAVRDHYAQRLDAEPGLVERLVAALLLPANEQEQALRTLAGDVPDAAPVWYYLGRRERGTPEHPQTPEQGAREAHAIRQFRAADKAGGLVPHFLDPARADAMRAELEARFAEIFPDSSCVEPMEGSTSDSQETVVSPE